MKAKLLTAAGLAVVAMVLLGDAWAYTDDGKTMSFWHWLLRVFS